MSDIIEKIGRLRNLMTMIGCSDEQITNAQKTLDMVFPQEYVTYMREFGSICFFGHEFTGLGWCRNGNENIGDRNVVTLTLQERELNDDFPPKMLALENAGIDGIIITVDESGAVYKVQYDECTKLCDSFSDYIDRFLNED